MEDIMRVLLIVLCVLSVSALVFGQTAEWVPQPAAIPAEARAFTKSDLMPGNSYQIKVQARNIIGQPGPDSDPSDPLLVVTPAYQGVIVPGYITTVAPSKTWVWAAPTEGATVGDYIVWVRMTQPIGACGKAGKPQ
jgi:hypothetical protein